MSQLARINTKNHLTQYVKRRADRVGFRLDSRCSGLMERVLAFGVERMVVASAVDRPDKLMQVEETLNELLECMCKHAKELRGYPDVTEKAFELAKREKGTLWPFF
ncbi:MAG: hypothetical protein PVF91_12930 [Chromatiales bacterium]